MCGIAGFVNNSDDISTQKEFLEAMTYTLAHRGPDATGFWISPHAMFGHQRLTVVDSAGGTQPMVRHRGDHTYAMVYNGELYNTQDLRNELKSKGHTFQSHSDTEVLLESFIEWGPGCVDHINGIYAFAVWNEKEQSLFL
jgi:asparagine synthase (glutamine-hydrolysing)